MENFSIRLRILLSVRNSRSTAAILHEFIGYSPTKMNSFRLFHVSQPTAAPSNFFACDNFRAIEVTSISLVSSFPCISRSARTLGYLLHSKVKFDFHTDFSRIEIQLKVLAHYIHELGGGKEENLGKKRLEKKSNCYPFKSLRCWLKIKLCSPLSLLCLTHPRLCFAAYLILKIPFFFSRIKNRM